MSNRIITISREFGSGGRTIGRKTAAQLRLPCYDAELIGKQPGCPRSTLLNGGNTPPTAAGWPAPSRIVTTTGILFKMICGASSGRLFWNWQRMGRV